MASRTPSRGRGKPPPITRSGSAPISMIGISSRRPSRLRRKSPRPGAARLLALLLAVLLGVAGALVLVPSRGDSAPKDKRGRPPEAADPLGEIVQRARHGERAEALALIEQFLKESPGSPLAARALLLAASFDRDAERSAERWERI